MQIDQKAAMHAAFQLAVNVNLEFVAQKTKKGPLFFVMVLARQDAIQALQALVHVDPDKPEDIRKLQNEVQRFLDLLTYVSRIFEMGDEAEAQLNAEAVEEVRELVAAEGGEIPGA